MPEAFTWRIAGRASHVPDDWRRRLAARLGERPRRLGVHAELALYGALEALADAVETELPPATLLRVCSVRGPVAAIGDVLAQVQSDLPLPFSFLQSQPSQMLAALAAALKWQGDGSFVVMRDRLALTALAAAQAGPRDMLLGWIEEQPLQSEWLRLVPCESPARSFRLASRFAQLMAPSVRWLQLAPEGVAFAEDA
jgi:hypothetical protein